MKKLLFIAAAVVAMAACNKTESSISVSNPEEIGFFAMTQNETRGYIINDEFIDVKNPDNVESGNTYNSTVGRDSSFRVMKVAAYNATDGKDYFGETDFSANQTISTSSYKTAIWHANPKLYWPIGKDLQFLTYSSQQAISGRNDVVAKWDGSQKVSFNVTPEQCYQNDIVYAQTKGNNRGTVETSSSSSTTGLNVTYYHSQAWLTFNVTVKGKDSTVTGTLLDSAKIKIDKIVLKDVYNSGVLTFEYDDNSTLQKPKASWDFFTQCKTDVEVDDPYNCMSGIGWSGVQYENGLLFAYKSERELISNGNSKGYTKDWNGFQLNMLMPEQKHSDFVLYYTMNNRSNSITLPWTDVYNKISETEGADFDETHKYPTNNTDVTAPAGLESPEKNYWKMGYHYIYNITIEINELTFNPVVTTWVKITGFNPNPQSL